MDVSAFTENAAGRLVPISGYDEFLQREYSHVAFVPGPLGDTVSLSARTYQSLSEADRAVGRLDAAVVRLPNPGLLVRPAIRREAVSTSALEGTFTTLLEVFEADYIEERLRTAQVREVLNYVEAAERGLSVIRERPISLNLLSELQAILVRGTPSDGASAGRLRQGQVYIGERARGIENARFVPPPAGGILDEVAPGMDAWEKWINDEDHLSLLVKAALGHYQFETLHPYSDGNGRLGRLVIALQLVQGGALTYPVLNLSTWLKDHETEYKDGLLACSTSGDFDTWVQFFARAVCAQADDAVRRIDELMAYKQTMIDALRADRARGVVLDIVEDLVGYPVITASQAAEFHNVTYPPANAAIQRLVNMGFLVEMTGATYGRTYGATEIMRIVDAPTSREI